MVKKLYKHEFLAYMRSLFPMHLIMLGVAALTRFVYFFESDKTVFKIVGVSSIVALVVACIVCLVLTALNVITRFYKNMFTHEGYLSFTLPVTNAQHIWVKATTGVVVMLIGVLAIFLAVCVATAGEFTIELFKAAAYLLKIATEEVGWQLWLYLIEYIALIVVSLYCGTLLYYACIAIGQLSNKNRVIVAIGVYFAYYFITQIISTVGMVVFSIISYTGWFSDLMESIGVFVMNHPYVSGHLFFLIMLAVEVLMVFVYYIITHSIMKKKLNLE